jgi:hypothetical protein
MPSQSSQRLFAAITCIIVWAGSILQYFLIIKNASANNLTALEASSNFLGYFTVLTNMLVAICLSFYLYSHGRWHRFFSRFSVQTAITVYIFIVGLGYNLLLRHLYHMKGLQAIANEIQHVVVPALFTLFWIIYVPKQRIHWNNMIPWMVYPFLYLVLALIRGSMDGFYPYPFLNISNLGLNTVLMNSVGLFLVFILISSIFIFISRKKGRLVRS